MGKRNSPNIGSDVLHSVSQGDKVAFARLHNAYEDFIRAAIRQYISDEDECNELTQEIFISLWERRATLVDVRNFEDYLFIVTRNRVFKYFSFIRKEAMIMKELQQRNADSTAVVSTELREYHTLWQMAVQMLPAQQKQVYTMIEQREETLDDVAGELGLARGTVKKHLELARKAVRKFIASQLEPGSFTRRIISVAALSLFIF